MEEHIFRNQLGNFGWEARNHTITAYHERTGGYKCPRCGNEKIGITYTTGTGACGKCNSSLLLTTNGIVALVREEPNKGWCHFWSNKKEWICKKCKNDDWGPVFCSEVEHICL